MTRSQSNSSVGDSLNPSLRPTDAALRGSVEQSGQIQAETAAHECKLNEATNIALALKGAMAQQGLIGSCKRSLWISYFFDGTGNNMEADVGLLKHSCIVRLFRVHAPDNLIKGVWRIYIPGLGTNFPKIGDMGGSLGLAFARGGDARIKFALDEFDRILARPLANATARTNGIEEINIAVFGFSRGAALARAFINTLMEERCRLKNGRWGLENQNVCVRFRFMGLFDTVASVGQPMSRNNTDYYNPALSDVEGMISERHDDYPLTWPDALAFALQGVPGADPAPGRHAGHGGWGAKMRIHETVEEVRHFVAAHEIRNSFPVDSISFFENGRIKKPAHFYETVYPGAHSDVGGGYAPGEGARAFRPSQNFCLIPLRHMYKHAVHAGVPMVAEWGKMNIQDFEVDEGLLRDYKSYMTAIGRPSNLGDAVNKHQQLYFAWRFRSIRRKKDGVEAGRIHFYDDHFRKQKAPFTQQLNDAKKKEVAANVHMNALANAREIREGQLARGGESLVSNANEDALALATEKHQKARWERVKAEAKESAVPDMTNFKKFLDLYDTQLLTDVETIRNTMRSASGKNAEMKSRKGLRPHYKALLEAWENEFENNCGLKDESIISFFDNYVHDSLTGFAKDATLPSDPRAIFVGGDVKLRFANLEKQKSAFDDEVRVG